MQGSELTSVLIQKAEELLADGKAQKILGWTKGLFEEDITPAVFSTKEELEENFIYNENCAANLSKYLLRLTKAIEAKKSDTRAKNAAAKKRNPEAEEMPVKEEVIAVFLKPCDTYSYTQLLKENRITEADVYAIGIPCDGMKAPHKDTLLEKCAVCKSRKHISCREIIGEEGDEIQSSRFDEVSRLEAMTADERYDFWQKQFSRCIRCNACRDVCPACTCEKCVFDNNGLYTSQKVAETSFEENLYHIIRAWHVAGRCTDCGECSRVCPEHIPLHLLNRKYIKDINEIYGPYQAGADMETKPPMLTFTEDDPETGIVYERSKDGGEQ